MRGKREVREKESEGKRGALGMWVTAISHLSHNECHGESTHKECKGMREEWKGGNAGESEAN